MTADDPTPRGAASRSLFLGALIFTLALKLPAASAEEKIASAEEPIAVLCAYTKEALPLLLKAADSDKSLRKGPLYIGQFGWSGSDAVDIHALPTGRYAPVLSPFRENYPDRELPADDLAKLAASSMTFGGEIPSTAALAGFSPRLQLDWGVELGRRMRDEIRRAQGGGAKIDSWIFNEVFPTVADKTGKKAAISRRFISGALSGLAYGRPELADKRMRGLVFIAGPHKFGLLPETEDVRLLMSELDHVALAILGEEYPDFKGDPKAAARKWARGVQALRDKGGVRGRLADRYVPVFTPGYAVKKPDGKTTFLGGNVEDKPKHWVDDWRKAFVAERMRLGAAGAGEYDFINHKDQTACSTSWKARNDELNNTCPTVIDTTVETLGHGVAQLRQEDAKSDR